MISSTITFSVAFLIAMTAAAPAALEVRQPGAVFVSVGDKFAGPGCTDQTLIFADPIFGNGNQCQPLDRSGDGTPIISYKTLNVSQGCSVTIYDAPNCGGTAFSAPVNGCVTSTRPFMSVFVKCPQ